MTSTINWRERFLAAGLHFAATVATAALAAALIFVIWFPGALADMAGGRKLFFLMLGIDVALGPLTSLVIYNSKKTRGKLLFDYTVIGILQLAALAYGCAMIAVSRPVFVVFTVDRLEVVAAIELNEKDLTAANGSEFQHLSWWGPRLAATELPQNAEQSNAVLFAATTGKDLQMFPQYYRSYETAVTRILQRSISLTDLRKKNNIAAQKAEKVISDLKLSEDAIRILPVHSRFGFWTAILDAENAKPIKYIPIDTDELN